MGGNELAHVQWLTLRVAKFRLSGATTMPNGRRTAKARYLEWIVGVKLQSFTEILDPNPYDCRANGTRKPAFLALFVGKDDFFLGETLTASRRHGQQSAAGSGMFRR